MGRTPLQGKEREMKGRASMLETQPPVLNALARDRIDVNMTVTIAVTCRAAASPSTPSFSMTCARRSLQRLTLPLLRRTTYMLVQRLQHFQVKHGTHHQRPASSGRVTGVTSSA
jgi:hypothetical protein